jgi:formate hydrogenlyase transcriptional activator
LTNNQYFDKKVNMKYKDKTKEQLINELTELHQRIEDLEAESTKRRKAEEALKVSETRYRRLFETAQDGIILLDADTGQILDINPFLLKMLGHSHKDFLGKKLWEIGPFSDIAASKLRFSELQTKGYVRYEHLPLETKDGRLINVEFVSNVYLVDKEKIIQCNIRDITLRKQTEEALRKAYDEMELRVRERTADLLSANEQLSQEIEDRKQAANSLREALTIIKQLKEQLHEENIYLKEEINLIHSHRDIVGNSEAIRTVLQQIEQVVPTDSTILIQGATGTGKELIAHAIHNLSARKGRLMVKVNCAALPPTLIESELFGREKGAFTGALLKQIGRFELADASTIFLDEIDSMPMELQAKLLRVVENGEFERLGSPRTVKVDVRIISATNRDLARLVSEGGQTPKHVPF